MPKPPPTSGETTRILWLGIVEDVDGELASGCDAAPACRRTACSAARPDRRGRRRCAAPSHWSRRGSRDARCAPHARRGRTPRRPPSHCRSGRRSRCCRAHAAATPSAHRASPPRPRSVTLGLSSYSTATRSAASCAAKSVSATTATTASPTKRTSSTASTWIGRPRHRRTVGELALDPAIDQPEPVGDRIRAGQHRQHAGNRRAAAVSMRTMRAAARVERTTTRCASPGKW